jgi:hypothetical protein
MVLPSKIEESYASECLLGFGKVYICERAWQTCTLNKSSKIHGLANLIGDLPLEYIKGVFSEILSTMSYSVNHRYIYIAGFINVWIYLSKYIPEFNQMSTNQKLSLIFFPSNFGGLPTLPYIRMLAKGDSDIVCC